jgi:hypothetical protein
MSPSLFAIKLAIQTKGRNLYPKNKHPMRPIPEGIQSTAKFIGWKAKYSIPNLAEPIYAQNRKIPFTIDFQSISES